MATHHSQGNPSFLSPWGQRPIHLSLLGREHWLLLCWGCGSAAGEFLLSMCEVQVPTPALCKLGPALNTSAWPLAPHRQVQTVLLQDLIPPSSGLALVCFSPQLQPLVPKPLAGSTASPPFFQVLNTAFISALVVFFITVTKET